MGFFSYEALGAWKSLDPIDKHDEKCQDGGPNMQLERPCVAGAVELEGLVEAAPNSACILCEPAYKQTCPSHPSTFNRIIISFFERKSSDLVSSVPRAGTCSSNVSLDLTALRFDW